MVVPPYQQLGNKAGVVIVVLTVPTPEWDGIPPLVDNGYDVITLDLPCEGANAEAAYPDGLACLAAKLHQGDDRIFVDFCAQLSNVLDAVNATEAGVVGVSRGGYYAITCSAYEPRFVAISLPAPVTDLNYLSEFQPPLNVSEALFNTQQYVPYLRGRDILVRVGSADTRVGTALVVQFAGEVGARLQVLTVDSAVHPHGHYTVDDGASTRFFNAYFKL